MHYDVAAHPHVSPSIIADVAPLPITVAARHQLPAIVSRPSTVDVRKPMSSMGRRQLKSSVSIGMNEPSVRAVCGCAVYILSSVVFRLCSRFELTVLLETCSPTGFSTCLHGY